MLKRSWVKKVNEIGFNKLADKKMCGMSSGKRQEVGAESAKVNLRKLALVALVDMVNSFAEPHDFVVAAREERGKNFFPKTVPFRAQDGTAPPTVCGFFLLGRFGRHRGRQNGTTLPCPILAMIASEHPGPREAREDGQCYALAVINYSFLLVTDAANARWRPPPPDPAWETYLLRN